jgi:hypothetical protein
MKESSVPRRYQLGVSSIPPVEADQTDTADDSAVRESEESDTDR